jgi:putative DNA methylase
MTTATTKKKLIEVALPLEAINIAAAHEKMPGIGPHPRGLHLWWARRPLAAARAVIFAQMVDDPSSYPDLFPTPKKQEKERQRLFKLIDELVKWENTTNETVLQAARDEIWQCWRRACAENADHPRAKELFDRNKLPAFHDPFAGGGALPLEAQRLGLESYASDLNPVAVLINKAMIEIPPKFAGKPPVNPEARKHVGYTGKWVGAAGLAEDVRYYGKWMRDEAEKRIGHLYPKIEITSEMVKERKDLKPYQGKELQVIAWIWARTVKSPNPAFAKVDVPLASTFMLSNHVGKEAYVEPVIEGKKYRFTVKIGKPKKPEETKKGTKSGSSGSSFLCLMSGTPMPFEYLRAEAKSGRMGTRLMAIVAEGKRERVYLSPTSEMEAIANKANPKNVPETDLPAKALGFRIQEYGMTKWCDLYTPRQLVALSELSNLIGEARKKAQSDAADTGLTVDNKSFSDGGIGAQGYADSLALYLAFAVDRCADFSNTCTRWVPGNQKVMNLFGKQAIAMTWDFPEAAILYETVGGFMPATKFISECILKLPQVGIGIAVQQDAMTNVLSDRKIVSTDPPYYDNIGYADLSDFFYVWMRKALKNIFPSIFSTVTVPKAEELIASPFRQGNSEKAEQFFLDGMTHAMHRIAEEAHPSFPITIYYAFKQSENESDEGFASTGWETFLDAVIHAGFALTGTWPMRSEQEFRMVGLGTNALASSIILVCRPRPSTAPTATRREFVNALKSELPLALLNLQKGNIAPVDLAQAAIGPGMGVYTRYSKVLDSEGKQLTVRDALTLINETLDIALAEQEGDFDADSRWALTWFEQSGFAEGEYGVAEQLSKSKNTSVAGMVHAGILQSKHGKVRLLKPSELPKDWDPETDDRLTTWEMVHHLIRVLEASGEGPAAELVKKLGAKAETARELCYRLYTICERKKRAVEALSYNALVQSWPEIIRISKEDKTVKPAQTDMFSDQGE